MTFCLDRQQDKKLCTAGQKNDLKAELIHCFNREVQLILVDDSYVSVSQMEKKCSPLNLN